MSRPRTPVRAALLALAALSTAGSAAAQLSLQSAVDLALRNSPRIRAAQADRAKAVASMQEARDAYIPVVVTQGGYGQSTGAPLSVPVVFSISAQSLGFSFQQRDNMRATRMGVESADHALAREKATIVEDVTNTYVSLSNALERQGVLREQIAISGRLSTIVQQRVDAGIDAKVELPKAHRTNTQLRLVSVQLDSEVAGYQQHLATLTGISYAALKTVRESIPAFAPPVRLQEQREQALADDEGVQALAATARAKQFLAFADRRYLLRPQIGISAYYSRIYTGSSSYLDYYPCFDGTSGRRGSICYDGTTAPKTNSENALGVGFQLTLPLLDYAHRAKARESAADAMRAAADVEVQRQLVRENRERLRHSTDTLVLRTELAQEDQEIAQDQLETIRLQLQTAGGGNPQLSPKDELNAELQERQRFYDLLLAQVQLQQTQLNILQQGGDLDTWVGIAPQTTPTVTPFGTPPAAPGTPPAAATPGTGSFPVPSPVATPAPPTAAPPTPH